MGAAAINQVDVITRVVIFVALLACSAFFAARLHLFEPVLRHHYNPKTHGDELVGPDNPAFEEETRAQHEHCEELLDRLHHRDSGDGRKG